MVFGGVDFPKQPSGKKLKSQYDSRSPTLEFPSGLTRFELHTMGDAILDQWVDPLQLRSLNSHQFLL